MIVSEERGIEVYARNGTQKTSQNSSDIGRTIPLMKTGTAPEAAGSFYCFAKDAGTP